MLSKVQPIMILIYRGMSSRGKLGRFALKRSMKQKAPRNPQLVAIGRHIRDQRKAHGYSQEAFAARAGLDRAYYGGIERGERNISALNLIRIARALDVEVGALFPALTDLEIADKAYSPTRGEQIR